MLNLVITFAIGLGCGIAASQGYVGALRKKVRFYESYIHLRLEEGLPYMRDQARLH